MFFQTHPFPHRIARGGFTLIELMVAIFLVLIIMLGVSRVFDMVSRAVGSGNSITVMNQNFRSAVPIIADDFRCAAGTAQPWMVIYNCQETAFMDQADQLSDSYYTSGSSDGGGAGEIAMLTMNIGGTKVQLPRTAYGQRSHRCDIIYMFASGGRYTSMDGCKTDGSQFVAPVMSRDAYICYGHVLQPTSPGLNATGNYNPLGEDNPGNTDFYARSWILGRMAIPLLATIPNTITGYDAFVSSRAGSPFNGQGPDVTSDSTNFYHSRFDVANTSLDQQSANVISQSWHNNNQWIEQTLGNMHGVNPGHFWCNPGVTKPITSCASNPSTAIVGSNFTTPIFLRNCSNFIVEWAGDFLVQNPTTGKITGVATTPTNGDGQTDFFIDPATGQKKIRWYGLPRDVNGDGVILSTAADPNTMVDVVPLRDVVIAAGLGTTQFWERRVTTAPINGSTNYADPVNGMQYDGPAWGGANYSEGKYWVGWLPQDPHPSMIRFIFTLEDPNGRVAGQTYEVVMNVQ